MLPNQTEYRSPLEGLTTTRFQGRTYGQESLTSVGTGLMTLLRNNPNRVFYQVINEGANDVRLSIDPTISGGSGWLLQANGGLVNLSDFDDGEVVGYALYAYGQVGASNVRALEIIRE